MRLDVFLVGESYANKNKAIVAALEPPAPKKKHSKCLLL
jgi:hypothetical protein